MCRTLARYFYSNGHIYSRMRIQHHIILFLLLNFTVAFISDIFLNDLSTHFNTISSLKSYFRNHSIVKSALDAGATVLFALVVTMGLSHLLFGFIVPHDYTSLLCFCILAGLIGYILDMAIYRLNVFGHRLDEYYKQLGAGLWGSVAFVFSIFISYFIQNYIIVNL